MEEEENRFFLQNAKLLDITLKHSGIIREAKRTQCSLIVIRNYQGKIMTYTIEETSN